MKKKHLYPLPILTIVFFSLLFFPGFLGSDYKYIYEPDSEIYFGHISYTEVKHDGKDPIVIREGRKLAEVAVLNFPLAPGDTVRTTEERRCEIQFDTGTVIRLDVNTELTIETVMAQSLSSWSKVTNLILHQGQVYVMYARYSTRELFQVKTPFAAVRMTNRTVAMIETPNEGGAEVQVSSGRVDVMYGPDENNLREQRIRKAERLVVARYHDVQIGSAIRDTDFEKWNAYINENFVELHRGKSFIPDPVLKYPSAVVYFARKYSNLYGEWVWDEYFGWVWRPAYEQYYPSGLWQPYFYGMWREINGQLFWVPDEPWGWAPYHLGVWHWNKKLGWVWIPGSAFAPAWVAWGFYSDYYFWRVWSLWDWFYYGYYPFGYGSTWSWNYYYPYWYDYYQIPGSQTNSVLKQVSKKQMQKPGTSPLSLPRELKGVYRNVITALKSKDGKIAESFWDASRHSVFVKNKDLNAQKIQERIISSESFEKKNGSLPFQSDITPVFPSRDPSREAVRTFWRNTRESELRNYVTPVLARTKEKARVSTSVPGVKFDARTVERQAKAITLFKNERYVFTPAVEKFSRSFSMGGRDWNSDVGVARRMGVEVHYSPRANEIRCPALGLTSKTVEVNGRGYNPRGSFYSYSPEGSRSSSSSSSTTVSSSTSSTGTSRGSGTNTGSGSRSGTVSKGEEGGKVSK